MFGLVEIIEGSNERPPVLDLTGKPLVFMTGTDAAEYAKYLADIGGKKCQPRRLNATDWHNRETARFADGTYIALPWFADGTIKEIAHHFPHISTEDGAKVAFTEDDAKGAADRQTRMKPGKYLQRYYADVLDAPTIARLSAEFSNAYGESNELQFASTEDDIQNVYLNGPRSCMAYAVNHYESDIHPTRVYAAGDLQLAYLKRDGDITARALCWPEKKIYGRVYGDETRLIDLFNDAGYQRGKLTGARLLRIEADSGFVVPYVDDNLSIEEDGDFLKLCRHGCIRGDCQNGLSGSRYRCDNCGDGMDEDDSQFDDNGDTYCQHCYDELYSYCERLEESVPRDEIEEVIVSLGLHRTQYWGERARDRYAFQCARNDNWYATDLGVEMANGDTWSQEAFEHDGFVCDGSGTCHDIRDLIQLADGTNWCRDHFDEYGVTIDGENYAAFVPKHKPSPTVVCDAQLEMPLLCPPHIQTWGEMFHVMVDGRSVSHWYERHNAEHSLAQYVRERLAT